jgi:16S rRNA (guanine(966)-N(2))-methyltransferase RsmD
LSAPRIIAGKARGKRLKDVPGDITRPITDRVKEALFNILAGDIVGACLLDLFGGTGSVGLEALSRGASFVRFIDLNRPAVETLKSNVESTGLKDGSQVMRMDAYTVLKQLPDRQFDYVYIAPPQYKSMWSKALADLDSNPGWLSDNAWVIVQIHPVEYQSNTYTNFKEFDQRKYGSTLLVFYERTDEHTSATQITPQIG